MTLELVANAAVRLLLLGVTTWLALRLVRVRNPHVEALIWRLVLLAGLALPALLYWRVAPVFATSFEPLEIIASGQGIGATPASDDGGPSLAGVAATIYLAVASLLIARLVGGLVIMGRVARAGRPMPTPDDVRISERVGSPATFGRIVLLPAQAGEWPAENLEAILAHERAHVRSRDCYWSWLAQLHAAVFWFNPFAWWIQRRLETLAETTSDDAVLLARHDPVAYAALLLDFARHPNSRRAAMSVADSNVPKRIERLLARIPPASALPRAVRHAAFALLIPVVVFAASTTRDARPTLAAEPRPAVLARAANVDDYYPAAAKADGVEGAVVVNVDVDSLGQIVDVRVLEAVPAEQRYGFADAAMQFARNSQYLTYDGQPSSVTFKVKFALSDDPTTARDARPVARLSRIADPDHYYPAAAQAAKMSGHAVVNVDVDARGRVADARVVKVEPADPRYGFADAALRVARNTGYESPSHQPASITFMVKFEPKQ